MSVKLFGFDSSIFRSGGSWFCLCHSSGLDGTNSETITHKNKTDGKTHSDIALPIFGLIRKGAMLEQMDMDEDESVGRHKHKCRVILPSGAVSALEWLT